MQKSIIHSSMLQGHFGIAILKSMQTTFNLKIKDVLLISRSDVLMENYKDTSKSNDFMNRMHRS